MTLPPPRDSAHILARRLFEPTETNHVVAVPHWPTVLGFAHEVSHDVQDNEGDANNFQHILTFPIPH